MADRTEDELLDVLAERLGDVDRETIKRVLTAYAWLKISDALDPAGVSDG